MKQWSAGNQNSDREMEPDICDTELHHVQGPNHAFKFSSAVGEFEYGASVCVQGDRRVLCPCELMGESLPR